MGGLRAVLSVFACALPLAAAAQEPERIAQDPAGASLDIQDLVEKLTGRAFEDYVREHVFGPLGMETSTFHFPRGAALLAKGYEADGASEAGYDHIITRPSGG